jgi:hypothetical protein
MEVLEGKEFSFTMNLYYSKARKGARGFFI